MSSDFFDIRAIGATFIVFTVVMLVAIAWPRGDFVLVVGRPGTDEAGMMEIVSEADGTFVASGNYGSLAVAHAERSGFTARLFKAGAILVLDHALAEGCLERK